MSSTRASSGEARRWRFLAPILLVAVSCGGSGSSDPGSPAAPPVATARYLTVEGTWSGSWILGGVVPDQVTLHLGQHGAEVVGTLWMHRWADPVAFRLTGSAGEDDGSGVGPFVWVAENERGRIEGSMTLTGTALRGAMSWSGDGEPVRGPIDVFRTGPHPE